MFTTGSERYSPISDVYSADPPHIRTQDSTTGMLAEGCFCPENQLLFNSRMDICVSECRKCHSPTVRQTLPHPCPPGYLPLLFTSNVLYHCTFASPASWL